MSQWGSAKKDSANNNPFGETDDTDSVSSKAPTRSQGITPNHIQNIRLIASKLAPDAISKQVGWFDIEITSIDTVWTVVKRFSDCSALHSAIEKLRLGNFVQPAGMPFPSFPSKFHVGKQSLQFLERRRSQLEQYFQQLLLFMQKLSISAVGERSPLHICKCCALHSQHFSSF